MCYNFFSDINSPPLFKNLPQTVSVLEGVTIGSSVYQLQVDDKNLMDSHLFFASYSPSEGAVYFDVNKNSMFLLYYIFYWRGFTHNGKYFGMFLILTITVHIPKGVIRNRKSKDNVMPKQKKKDTKFTYKGRQKTT